MPEARTLYLMLINGARTWLPLSEAGQAYDSGWADVRIGGQVLLGGVGAERDITDFERQRIVDIAEECSASK